MNKTVYITGAGFSINSGAPSQEKLLEAIFALRHVYSSKKNSSVNSWLNDLEKFMTEGLRVSNEKRDKYALEDIYTPIDKAILESSSFQKYTSSQLVILRNKINKLVMLAVRETIMEADKDKTSIKKFAKYLTNQARLRLKDEKNDSVSVITTNWDIILDNEVYAAIKISNDKKNSNVLGVVDYCCYISSLDESDETIKPGLYAIGKGGFNVKILKLHGSLNWMQCSKCQRLYVKLYKRFTGGYIFNKKYCRHCEQNFKNKNDNTNLLSTNLITPTFLKNLNNIQNKLIWQNAGVELSEASRVVFLGYSLPAADFEFKQLMSKMLRSDAKIEVYLVANDNPELVREEIKQYKAGYRYQTFFSGREITIYYSGVEEFMSQLP